MKKSAAITSLTPNMAEFLATPVRLPPTTTPVEKLTEACKKVVDELLMEAYQDQILPRATLGVGYLSLEPKSGELSLRSHLLWWGGDEPGVPRLDVTWSNRRIDPWERE